MSTRVKRECPREAFIKGRIPSGATKHAALRGIMKRVILAIDIGVTSDTAVEKMVNDEFAALSKGIMLPFEAEEEAKRMVVLIRRWLDYERGYISYGKVLKKDFSSTFSFAGQQKSHVVHYLMNRGRALEAIQFKYKEPEYSIRGRTPATRPEGSPELLMLQRAGEAEARKMGIDPYKKPVYGSIYYLKSRGDTAAMYAPTFEDEPGYNIISHCFTKSESAQVESDYSIVAPDVSKTCDKKDCRDCLYEDLCYMEFEKRHQMERPPVELKSIDEIHLTDAQSAFISFTDGECRVNAVAGSGKTTIVTLRTLALIEDGVKPENILMVTFSEKARDEMALRLRSFAIGKMMEGTSLDVEKVDVQTFNSWGQHLLNKNYALLGFTSPPMLVDDIKKKDVIIDLLSVHRHLPVDYRNPFMSTKAAEGAVVKMAKWIDSMKAAHVETAEDVTKALGGTLSRYAQELLEIYEEYNKRLLAMNSIDYEDQLRLLLQLADFGVFEKLTYEHVVVDEFQDSNPNQIAIILELKRRNPGVRSLVVVGDELQAIYGFRNATPDNLVSFGEHFPNMVDIDLTANFRSQEPIIQLANQIIRKTAKLGKAIEAHKTSSSVKPAVMEVLSDEAEIDLYTRQVKKFIRNGVKPSSIAILCRTRAELIKQQMSLDKEGIPTILKVPEIIADAPYVKAVIGLASFLKDNTDLASFALYAKSLGQDPFDEVSLASSSEAILKVFEACTSEEEKLDAFFSLIEDASEDYVANAFIEKMKRLQFKTLNQYLNYCVKYRDYKVRDTQSTIQEKTDCVTLITVHSAKGLEWDNVLLSLKRFPLDEESCRLFYVGVTRAKEKLLLTYTKKQTILANMVKSRAT